MDEVKIYAGGGHVLRNDTCRLCLRRLDIQTRHWALFHADLPQKLMAFAAVQIQENDGLPTVICTNCHNLVYMTYDFKCQVEKSDHDLRQALLVKQSTTEWCTVPIIKPIENISPTEVMAPCLQKSIMNSCMLMQNEHNVNPHDQFIFEITNSCNVDSQMCKPEDHSPSNNSIETEYMIQNSNNVSFEINNVIPLHKNNDEGNIITFEAQYEIKNELHKKNSIKKVEPVSFRENSNPSDDEKPLILRTKRHKCNYCIKSFANLALLEKHALVHKKLETAYTCYLCDKQFNTVDKVKSHAMATHNMHMEREKIMENSKMRRITGWVKKIGEDDQQDNSAVEKEEKQQTTNVFTCNICCRQFSNRRSLSAHLKTHTVYNNKVLNLLNKSPVVARSQTEANFPLENVDSNSNTANVKTSSQSGSLEMSPAEKRYENSRQCISSEDSMDESELEDDDDDDEQDEDDNIPVENIQCNQCGKLVATLRNLKRHLLTHSGLKHNCSICGKDFSRPDKLREHQQLKHKEELFSKSDSENESSDENNTVVKKKKDKSNRPFKCSECPKAFAQPQSLANHEERHKRVRDVQKRYLCEVCSKCFAQSGSLVAHMRTHTGVKPYVCIVCSRAFTKRTYLQLHLRTHSGEKPYICQYCSRAFARANTLARHITMHTGEAKYQCQICTKSFRRLTSLNEHTYTHTGQKPYACKICSKRYNNAGSLYAHTKKCKAIQDNANSTTNSVSLQSAENTMPPQSDNNPPQPLLIFTEKNMDEVITDEVMTSDRPACQFMIANVQAQKPIPANNMLESFMIQEPDVYNINSKQFKTPYYGLYPSM